MEENLVCVSWYFTAYLMIFIIELQWFLFWYHSVLRYKWFRYLGQRVWEEVSQNNFRSSAVMLPHIWSGSLLFMYLVREYFLQMSFISRCDLFRILFIPKILTYTWSWKLLHHYSFFWRNNFSLSHARLCTPCLNKL